MLDLNNRSNLLRELHCNIAFFSEEALQACKVELERIDTMRKGESNLKSKRDELNNTLAYIDKLHESLEEATTQEEKDALQSTITIQLAKVTTLNEEINNLQGGE